MNKVQPRIFAGVDAIFGNRQTARAVIVPVPYDGTSTWGKGADAGPDALLDAADNMELYDMETGIEGYRKGICLDEPICEGQSPESMTQAVKQRIEGILVSGQVPVVIGGEHSVSIGAIQACAARHPNLSVLQLDAHSDLRPTYMGSACNHACALHWASQHLNLVQVGIRSQDISEKAYEQTGNVFDAESCAARDDEDWVAEALERCGAPGTPLYMTIDLDAFDPAFCPDTGTPEPGGLNWWQVLKLAKGAMERFDVVGFDVVELAAHSRSKPSDFLAAKLIYKMLTYRLMNETDLA